MEILHDCPGMLANRFDLIVKELTICGETFSMTSVRDTNVLLDRLDTSLPDAEDRVPYWAEVWTAAFGLAEWCLTARMAPGVSVLELGCGTGLVGIAAAKAGACVTLTDYNQEALAFARMNVTANLRDNQRANVIVSSLDWRTPPGVARFDLILGADILYDRNVFPALAALLCASLRPGGMVILADPGRAVAGEFLRAIAEEGFTVTQSAVTVMSRPDRARVTLCVLMRMSP
jgi:predicted nicotinamide N-methyase